MDRGIVLFSYWWVVVVFPYQNYYNHLAVLLIWNQISQPSEATFTDNFFFFCAEVQISWLRGNLIQKLLPDFQFQSYFCQHWKLMEMMLLQEWKEYFKWTEIKLWNALEYFLSSYVQKRRTQESPNFLRKFWVLKNEKEKFSLFHFFFSQRQNSVKSKFPKWIAGLLVLEGNQTYFVFIISDFYLRVQLLWTSSSASFCLFVRVVWFRLLRKGYLITVDLVG